MEKLNTTAPPPLEERHREVERLIEQQRRRDSLQSVVVGIVVVCLIGAVLWLIAIFPKFNEPDVMVTYSAPNPEKEDPTTKPDLAKGIRPKPESSSSARARVIAAQLDAPVAVPTPDNPDPIGPFGVDDDFNAGFGSGDGDGDGGGGASFFGTPRHGRRVVYLVDFSGSMASDATGGSRISLLKKELIRSINELSGKMSFAVIFFSHNSWSIDIDDPDAGWNGLGDTPVTAWYPATPGVKEQYIKKINLMGPKGNTAWYPPLKMAFAMIPPPDIVYLLSDGEPRDFNQVLNELDEINPHTVPVDTIAFELPGTPARNLMEIAQQTGGHFTLIYNGKRLRGMVAEKYTSSKYDDF
jgi:hypothetical protein